jgi:hypothetical protein
VFTAVSEFCFVNDWTIYLNEGMFGDSIENRREQGGEKGDDGDNHKQFNERKPLIFVRGFIHWGGELMGANVKSLELDRDAPGRSRILKNGTLFT